MALLIIKILSVVLFIGMAWLDRTIEITDLHIERSHGRRFKIHS